MEQYHFGEVNHHVLVKKFLPFMELRPEIMKGVRKVMPQYSSLYCQTSYRNETEHKI
jgi:hypothetical protein